MHQLEPTAPATAFVPASVFLQRLHDEAPTDHFVLGWLMSRMHKRSFGLIMTQNRMPWLLEIDGPSTLERIAGTEPMAFQ
jgi:hypothetical protein